MSYDLIIMEGEGIGKEVIPVAVNVIKTLAELFNIDIHYHHYEAGIDVYSKCGTYLSEEAMKHCDSLHTSSKAAILFGAVSDEPIGILRKKYDLFANVRPVKFQNALQSQSPLKLSKVENTDVCIVRELTSDVYYGKERSGYVKNKIKMASQEMYYDEEEIRRITQVAFSLASERKKCVTLAHKNNAIKGVYNLWMDVFNEYAAMYPQIKCENLLIDNLAMQFILRPYTFDVILCSNLFGDILSDIGAGIIGAIGLLPSMSSNASGFALYEGIGGTAPDIAGKNIANPVGSVLSIALFCRYTLKMNKLASLIEQAVDQALLEVRTPDISDSQYPTVSTLEMGNAIIQNIKKFNLNSRG